MPFERDDTRKQVIAIVAEQLSLPVEKIKDDDTLETLGADSLDYVEMVMKLEEHFTVEINDAEAEKLKTIRALIDYVHGLRV